MQGRTWGDCDFNWGLSDKGIDYVLFTAVRVLFIALVSVTKLFDVNKTERFDKNLTKLPGLLRANNA
jgi:hypothetical protein